MSEVVDDTERRRRIAPIIGRVGARFGLSSGQAYSVLTGIGVALTLGLLGLPPVLDGTDQLLVAPVGTPPEDGATPTTTVPAPPGSEVVIPVPTSPPIDLGSGGGLGGDLGSLPTEPSSPVTAPPSTVFAGSTTTPINLTVGPPSGIAVAPDGVVFVAIDNAPGRGTAGPSMVVAIGPDGAEVGRWSVPGQPAQRSRGLTAVARDAADGSLVVTDGATARVMRLDVAAGAFSVVGTIPDVPTCLSTLFQGVCEPGLNNGKPDLRGVIARPGGGYYVADQGQGTVWLVETTGVRPFVALQDRTDGQGPVALALASPTQLLVAVSGRLTALPPGAASIVAVAVNGNTGGLPTTVKDLASGEVPSGLARAASGAMIVTVPGRAAVLSIDQRSGKRVALAASANGRVFLRPVAAAWGDGRLYVVEGQATGGGSWTMHRIARDDQPVSMEGNP